MKLVQKMFVGLSLAGSLMLGSCSKEDTQMVEPEVNVNESSNLRTNVLNPILVPDFAPTEGQLGQGYFPQKWSGFKYSAPNAEQLPGGTSSLTVPYGYLGLSWVEPIDPIPGLPSDISIISVEGYLESKQKGYKYRGVATNITKLMPGKDYEITFYVCASKEEGNIYKYASGVNYSIEGIASPIAEEVALGSGSLAKQWIKKTLKFTAALDTATFKFWPKKPTVYGTRVTTNIFVAKNAIKQLN